MFSHSTFLSSSPPSPASLPPSAHTASDIPISHSTFLATVTGLDLTRLQLLRLIASHSLDFVLYEFASALHSQSPPIILLTTPSVINRLIETLLIPSVLSKHYGSLDLEYASFPARSIEEDDPVACSSSYGVFALNGAYVVVADILDEQGLRLADLIGGIYVHCDVSIESDVEEVVKKDVEWKGRLDVMFSNAGITKVEMEKVKSLLGVNVYGMMHGIKHAARAMIKGQNSGCIICTSSSAAIRGGLASHAYSM